MKLTALLIQHQVLEFPVTYGMLEPSDAAIKADSDKELGDAKEFVRRLNVVSTNKSEQPAESESEIAAKSREKVILTYRESVLRRLSSFLNHLYLVVISVPKKP